MEMNTKHNLVFWQLFEANPTEVGIKNEIVSACQIETLNWFEDECREHKIEILNFLLLVLLRKHALWDSYGNNKKAVRKLNNSG